MPFSIILIANSFLIYEMIKFERNKIVRTQPGEERKERKTMTISVAALTFGFILLTAPSALGGIYFRGRYILYIVTSKVKKYFAFFCILFFLGFLFSSNGQVVLWFVSALVNTYHASNFLFLMISNKRFSQQFKALINLKPSGKDKSTSQEANVRTDKTRL